MLHLSRLHIHCFIPYIIRHRILYFISKLIVLLNRYLDTSLSEKKIYQFTFKSLLTIHAHLHLQNSIYSNFLHLQRNDLPKIIDFKILKQRK